MKDKVAYRKVKVEELEMYHNLRLDCLKKYPENFGTLYEEEIISSSFKFDKIVSEQSKLDFLMGAYFDNKLIGICGFINEKRLKTKHIGEISGMYVATEFSGQKIGSRLLSITLKTAFDNLDLEQIILAVADKNQTAQTLYKKFGFVEYGRLENYFKNNAKYETQIFMVLTRDKNKTTNL
jgi:RimJ/RimL family protein N-acetyltransferase